MPDFVIYTFIVGALLVGAGKAYLEMFGAPNSKVKCQFCGAEGAVRVTDVTRKTGISGGKAAGAIVTGGASILATGLSQKKPAKHLSCRNCGMETDVF